MSKRVINAAYAIVSRRADATGHRKGCRAGGNGSSITGISKLTVRSTVLHPFHKTGKTVYRAIGQFINPSPCHPSPIGTLSSSEKFIGGAVYDRTPPRST